MAGSNKTSLVPPKKASQSVHATRVDFSPRGADTNHVSGAKKPDSMAAPMSSPSILQYGQMSAENASLLYSPQDGTGYNSMPVQQQSFAAGGAILNGTTYNFNQPLQTYAESAW